MQVGALLADGALAQQLLTGEQIAHAQARADQLGKAAQIDHAARRIVAFDGRQGLAPVAQVAVGVVLGHDEAVFGGQLRDGLPPVGGQRAAGGILERRDHVKQPGMIPARRFLKRIQLHAALVALDGDEVGLVEVHGLHVAKEGRAFHQHRVAGVDQRLEQQVHAAGAARGGKHAVAGHGEAEVRLEVFRQAFDKGRIALRGAVLQNALAVDKQHVARKLGAELVGQGVQRRVAAGEADHAGTAQHLEDLADGAAGHVVKPAGEGNRLHEQVPP